jgi:2'-5' RNA ligase
LNDWVFSGFIDVDCGGIGDRHVDLFWGIWSLFFNLKTDKYRDRFLTHMGVTRWMRNDCGLSPRVKCFYDWQEKIVMRLFIAINFNGETKPHLLTLRDELKSNAQSGRFSPPENLHLTLAFIGEVNPKKVEKIKDILETVEFTPFDVAIDRLGTFSRGTLWWAGLREDKPLLDLQYEVIFKLAHCGFEMDGREYHPHITLGREVVTSMRPRSIEPFGETVHSIELMKSERIGGRMVYTAIYTRKALTYMNKPFIGVVPLWDNEKQRLWIVPGYMNGITNAGGIPVMLPLVTDEVSIRQLTDEFNGFFHRRARCQSASVRQNAQVIDKLHTVEIVLDRQCVET